MRGRELGIEVGTRPPGPENAITDVAGVRVGSHDAHRGRRPAGGRRGPGAHRRHGDRAARRQRLGGAAVRRLPPAQRQRRDDRPRVDPRVGHADVARSRSPTRTASASCATRWSPSTRASAASRGQDFWALPVVGETWDGVLNDINGMHVRAEHVFAALDAAAAGPVAEGNVGGGTGMICHEFKGGIGTASRVLEQAAGGFTVGVLVQANHGRRERLAVNGVPVGAALDAGAVPSPYAGAARGRGGGIDHRDRRHRRAAAAAPVHAAGAARRLRHRPDGRRRRALERRPLAGLLHRQPRAPGRRDRARRRR